MDLLSLLRMIGGLGVVLGILAGALWLVRRYDLRLPGRAIAARERRLELVETLSLDGRRMVALLRRDGREHLFLIAPEGHLVLESGVIRDSLDDEAEDARRIAREAAARARSQPRLGNGANTGTVPGTATLPAPAPESFADLVDQVRAGAMPAALAMKAALDHAVWLPRPLAAVAASPARQRRAARLENSNA